MVDLKWELCYKSVSFPSVVTEPGDYSEVICERWVKKQSSVRKDLLGKGLLGKLCIPEKSKTLCCKTELVPVPNNTAEQQQRLQDETALKLKTFWFLLDMEATTALLMNLYWSADSLQASCSQQNPHSQGSSALTTKYQKLRHPTQFSLPPPRSPKTFPVPAISIYCLLQWQPSHKAHQLQRTHQQ